MSQVSLRISAGILIGLACLLIVGTGFFVGFQNVGVTPDKANSSVPQQQATPLPSVGVSAHHAHNWHAGIATTSGTRYKGAGAKVGIIDQGFEGIGDFIGTELPIYLGVGSGAKHGS